MGKKENAHFLLVEGGCEKLFMPLVSGFLTMSCFHSRWKRTTGYDSHVLLDHKLLQGRIELLNVMTASWLLDVWLFLFVSSLRLGCGRWRHLSAGVRERGQRVSTWRTGITAEL